MGLKSQALFLGSHIATRELNRDIFTNKDPRFPTTPHGALLNFLVIFPHSSSSLHILRGAISSSAPRPGAIRFTPLSRKHLCTQHRIRSS
jgi:hypothetical protein